MVVTIDFESPETLPCLPVLRYLRERMEAEFQLPKFPSYHCRIASDIVKRALPNLRSVAGNTAPDFEPRHHDCNSDPDRRLFIDLTLDQYGSYPTIAVVKPPGIFHPERLLFDTTREEIRSREALNFLETHQDEIEQLRFQCRI